MAIALSLYNILHAMSCQHAAGCVGDYWADYWLRSYHDGYARRALAGEVLRWLSGARIAWLPLNIIAFAIAVLALLICYGAYLRDGAWRRHHGLPLLLLLCGPATTVLFETLGDLLQAGLLLTAGYALLAARLRPAVSLLLGLVVAAIVTQLHEAALLLLVPGIYLIHCVSHGLQVRQVPLALAVWATTAVYATQVSDVVGALGTLQLTDRDGNTITSHPATADTIWFWLRGEIEYFFGSAAGLKLFVQRVTGIVLWPALAVWALVAAFGQVRLLRIFVSLWVISLPLYAVAHDWGRFSLHVFLVSLLVVAAAGRPVRLSGGWLPGRWLDHCGERLAVLGFSVPLFVSLPLFFHVHGAYREQGLQWHSAVLVMATLALAVVLRPLGAVARDG